MRHQTISATEFKAKCLSLLSEIDEHGGTITITKRGRPMATLGQVKKSPFKSSAGVLAGKIKILGDLDKIDTADLWDVVRCPDEVLNPKAKSRR